MKFVTLCLCILVSLIFVNSIYALIDDFNDGKDNGWKPIQGKWSVIKGEYAQEDTVWTTTATHDTYTRSFFGDENWTDYTLEAKVRIEKGGELAPIIGIFFRVVKKSETGDYYYDLLNQKANGLQPLDE